ncbi:conserved hypothetical protein [Luminiphilus syltensis NOR5-1B]|uniref:Uncharacterized protein n=1 Tax=Luminiphilus syltensis NOR5-1B TaxID=565045 RepID=B8KXV4_9GAMM|nr:hypothetical protein [Luminiphilus syltensis]EED35054.1 conserved hypothetical protein [Luminiphilus syltensis NOR5-1B]
MKKAAVLLWFLLLPYLSRLPGGIEWVKAYLPDEGMMLFGLVFFGAFNLLPVVVMSAASKVVPPRPRVVTVIPFVVMSVATVVAHFDYDLSSDAQAAIWLIVAPAFVAILGAVSLALTRAAIWLAARQEESSRD